MTINLFLAWVGFIGTYLFVGYHFAIAVYRHDHSYLNDGDAGLMLWFFLFWPAFLFLFALYVFGDWLIKRAKQ